MNIEQYQKVGRIRYNSWAIPVLKACDIVISDYELEHIYQRHKQELENLGMSAVGFVKYILLNFNEIYEGKLNRKILVDRQQRISNQAIIELELSLENKKEVYKIITAVPIETKRLKLKKLLRANVR